MCWNCWYACLAQGCILPKSQGFFHQSDCVKVLDPPKGMWIDCLTHWIWSQICGYSCWWKKSCTTWDVETLVNNGINYQPQLVQDFLHQQSLIFPASSFFWVILLRSCTKRFRSSSTEECRGMPQNGWGFCRLRRVCRAHPEKLRHVASFRTWLWLKLAKMASGKN